MKIQIQLFLLIAVVALLVRAQTPAEPQYGDIISNLNIKFPLDNYRPLLSELKVENFQPEDEERSTVSVKTLTFPAQETVCDAFASTLQEDRPCPLKENGKLMRCSMQIAHPVQDVSDITAFEMSCEKAAETQGKIRTRRNKKGGRGGRGGRGRPGGGSSIGHNNK